MEPFLCYATVEQRAGWEAVEKRVLDTIGPKRLVTVVLGGTREYRWRVSSIRVAVVMAEALRQIPGVVSADAREI